MSEVCLNSITTAYNNKVLVWPKDPADPTKQDGVVYRIPWECSKIYTGETGRPMQDRIKEHNRDIWLARTQTSPVSEYAHNTGH